MLQKFSLSLPVACSSWLISTQVFLIDSQQTRHEFCNDEEGAEQDGRANIGSRFLNCFQPFFVSFPSGFLYQRTYTDERITPTPNFCRWVDFSPFYRCFSSGPRHRVISLTGLGLTPERRRSWWPPATEEGVPDYSSRNGSECCGGRSTPGAVYGRFGLADGRG